MNIADEEEREKDNADTQRTPRCAEILVALPLRFCARLEKKNLAERQTERN